MSTKILTKLAAVKRQYSAHKSRNAGNASSKRSINRILKPDEHPRSATAAVDVPPSSEPNAESNDHEDEVGDAGDLTDDMVVFCMAAMAQGEEEINPDGEDAVAPLPVSQQPRLNKDVYENTTDFSPHHSSRVAEQIASPLIVKNDSSYPQEVVAKLKNYRTAKFPLFHLFGYPGNQDICHPGHVELFPLIPEHEE